MNALPRRPLTVADLDSMPDDGHRYELIDGTLIVSPGPIVSHQRAVSRLLEVLFRARPETVEVFTAPLDVRLAKDTQVQPDILVVAAGIDGPGSTDRRSSLSRCSRRAPS